MLRITSMATKYSLGNNPDEQTHVQIFHGKQAVKKVTEALGRPLSLLEKRVVEEEGYATGKYEDTKGIITNGVGQTGDYMGMSFDETFQAHLKEAKRLVPAFDSFPEEVQAELVQAAYRGDLGGSPTALKKLNAGDYEGFATDFLDHKEYKDKKTSSGIKRRLEKVASAVGALAPAPADGVDITAPVPMPDLANKEDIKKAQKALGVAADGIWGPKSQTAWEGINELFAPEPDDANPYQMPSPDEQRMQFAQIDPRRVDLAPQETQYATMEDLLADRDLMGRSLFT
jgi:GH24 family phage-related lysozyme (muramidase)